MKTVKKPNKHIGSKFDDFLDEEGTLKETKFRAREKLVKLKERLKEVDLLDDEGIF